MTLLPIEVNEYIKLASCLKQNTSILIQRSATLVLESVFQFQAASRNIRRIPTKLDALRIKAS